MYAGYETAALSKDLEYDRGNRRGIRDHGYTGKELLINGHVRVDLRLQWECAPKVSDSRSC